VKVVLASEVYPPRAGGAGWSTRALALALREAGHDVSVLTTSPGPEDPDGLRMRRLVPHGRKRVAVPRAFASSLQGIGSEVVHAQHHLSALGCLAGLRPERVAVTVRDHWPVCFWGTRMSQGALCPECGVVPMTRCVVGRVPAPAPFSWAAVPYMRADLGQKRAALHGAGATLAVSEAIAAELRSAGIPRVSCIPNIVDAKESRAIALKPPSFALPDRFLLFVGKLEENKGARLLVPAVAEARTGLPLVVVGEGSLAQALKSEATAANVPLILTGWAHRDDVLRAMARATLVVFPSVWHEPLSRVLLEAMALGVPIAAMDTGGTRELLGGESGLLVQDRAGLSRAVAELAGDSGLRARISEGARARAEAFSPEALVPRYEEVYRRLL
jgi:glycogen(starch) synthase